MGHDHDPRPMRDAVRFFARFLRSPGQVGAVLPSSPQLARALVGPLDLGKGDVVVEYGPGTGAITQRIAEVLPDGVRYLGIELESTFVERLRARFPKLSFHEGSVADVREILDDEGLARPRAIISGLPFASLPSAVREAVIDATADVLAEGGQFRTFQYVHAWSMGSARQFREAMEKRLPRFERSKPIVRNVPPAYVLSYAK